MTFNITSIKHFLEPYRGVIQFCVVLAACHFFWKYTVIGEETGDVVTFFGWNISAPFIWMSKHVALAAHAIINFFGGEVQYLSNNILRFANGQGVQIVWSCSGIKQAYIFTCIILFSRGPWKHKAWFIPAGVLVCFLINIVRIIILVVVIENHQAIFKVLHESVLKYIFYGIIFLMWVLWEEKIATVNLSSEETEKQT